jgi:uncharacterized membrane protein
MTTLKTLVVWPAIFAVVVGVFARLDGLDRKLFWQDEAFSMLRITGHDRADLDALFDGRIHRASAVAALDRLDPSRGSAATIASLREEPQRGPLFYLAANLWARVAGDGVARMRLLSALIGIAGIGFAFLLGRAMAGDATGGAVLAALVALAPVDVRFSDQVREYALLETVTLASAWLLLRALARPTLRRCGAYAAGMCAGLLASPLFASVIVAHAVVAAVAARRDGRERFVRWIASVVVALALVAAWYVPALGSARAHGNDVAWLLGPYSVRSFALKWAFNIGAVFFDAEFARVRFGVVLLPIFATVAAALVSIATWPRDAVVRALVIATTLSGCVPLVILDVVRHAHFETVTRYAMTTWAGVAMLVALLLARGLAKGGLAARAALATFACALGCGVFSAVFARPYGLWWDDNEHLDERAVARAIEAGTPGIVVATSEGSAQPYALVLSRYLPARTGMLLYRTTLPAAATAARHVWYFAPDADVVRAVERRIAPERTLRNVSPAIDLAIPDLRGSRDVQASAALRADNALWHVVASRAATSASPSDQRKSPKP